MAFFFTNKCQYSNCGRQFPTLNDLIIHIEDTHIDFDPKTLEESERSKPLCVPMSYILRYNREEKKPEAEGAAGGEASASSSAECGKLDSKLIDGIKDIKIEPDQGPSCSSTVPEDHFNKSLLFCAESNGVPGESKCKSKKFCCPVSGCNKRYKNQNGMKYHIVNYHDMKGNLIKPKKDFKCQCGREYKTLRGLQSHSIMHKENHQARASTASVWPENYRHFPTVLPHDAGDHPVPLQRRASEPPQQPSESDVIRRSNSLLSFSTVYPDFHFEGFDG